MEKLPLLFLLLLQVCFLCPGTSQVTILRGNIGNAEDSASIQYEDQLGRHNIILSDGKFEVHFDYPNEAIISLHTGKNQHFEIHLQSGDEIQLSFDMQDIANSLRSLTFAGDHVVENQTLKALKSLLIYDNTDQNHFYDCGQKDFLSKITALTVKAQHVLDGFVKTSENTEFVELAQAYIDYNIAYYLTRYPDVNRISFARKDLVLEPEMKDKLKESPLEQSELLNHAPYKRFLEYSSYQLIESFTKNPSTTDAAAQLSLQLSAIDQLFKNPDIQIHLKYVNLLYQLIFPSRFDASAHFKAFINQYKETAYAKRLEKLYQESTNKLRAGEVVPDFVLKNSMGETVHFNTLKGKYLYIDFWATWCAPCTAEQPYIKTLKEAFANRDDVEFVGISIDQDDKKWRQMVAEQQLPGIQLLDDPNSDSSLSKAFEINAIPRFIILDKDGKVLDANAPRPSSGKVEKLLWKLLERKE